jgi:hypothetical protein
MRDPGSAIKTRTRNHTETKELQWEFLSGAAIQSIVIVDNADVLESDDAKSDRRRRRSIRIPPDQLARDPRSSATRSATRPHLQEWIEHAWANFSLN